MLTPPCDVECSGGEVLSEVESIGDDSDSDDRQRQAIAVLIRS